MDQLDHIAIAVRDISSSVDWYLTSFICELVYQTETEAMIQFENVKVQLLLPSQLPPHIALVKDDADTFGRLKKNKDGTSSCYVSDPTGNPVEIISSKASSD